MNGRLRTAMVACTVCESTMVQAAALPVTTPFDLAGAVGTTGTYDPAALQALPATTRTVTGTAGGRPVSSTYAGVPLADLPASAGDIATPPVNNGALHSCVVAVSGEGFAALFPPGETASQFDNQPTLIAWSDTHGQLGTTGTHGFARMVAPGDTAGGRYVSNIISIQVIDATVPWPVSLAFLVMGTPRLAAARARSRTSC